jgi:predicted oxidoreductase
MLIWSPFGHGNLFCDQIFSYSLGKNINDLKAVIGTHDFRTPSFWVFFI